MDTALAGKTIVVSGATSGIGRAAAEQIVQAGGYLIGIGRSQERCATAQEELRASTPQAQVDYVTADLSAQSEVRNVAEQITELVHAAGAKGVDVLLNNAGTFHYWLTLTPEGFEMQWAVNHLAPFLLTHSLLPLLKAAPQARVITVSSGSHYNTKLKWDDIQLMRRYNGLRAYKQTKLANALFMAEFNRRAPAHMRAFAADPGLVDTQIGSKSDSFLSRWIWDLRRRSGITPEESAAGIVHLVSAPELEEGALYWKHGKPKDPSPYALNADVAGRLWALSEKMCAIEPGSYFV